MYSCFVDTIDTNNTFSRPFLRHQWYLIIYKKNVLYHYYYCSYKNITKKNNNNYKAYNHVFKILRKCIVVDIYQQKLCKFHHLTDYR